MERVPNFPGWEIKATLGQGSFGKVYEIHKCVAESDGEYKSALKVISIPTSAEQTRLYREDGYDDASIQAIHKEQVDEIVSEIKIISKFKGSANIVSYEDHIVLPKNDGLGWDILIRMELLTPLTKYYQDHPLSEGEIITLGLHICDALKRCQQKNIIHRDIKPQNIFINEFGDFKLGDFGIARTIDNETSGTRIGTATYMAPEVYSGKTYGFTADVYSLGMVLYWALNERRLPFLPLPPAIPSMKENNEAMVRRLKGEPVPAPKHGSGKLKLVILKALEFDPQKRYATIEEFRQSLLEAEKFVLDTAPVGASEATNEEEPASSENENAPIVFNDTGDGKMQETGTRLLTIDENLTTGNSPVDMATTPEDIDENGTSHLDPFEESVGNAPVMPDTQNAQHKGNDVPVISSETYISLHTIDAQKRNAAIAYSDNHNKVSPTNKETESEQSSFSSKKLYIILAVIFICVLLTVLPFLFSVFWPDNNEDLSEPYGESQDVYFDNSNESPSENDVVDDNGSTTDVTDHEDLPDDVPAKEESVTTPESSNTNPTPEPTQPPANSSENWSAWSGWSTTAVSPSASTQVESKQQYRSRTIQDEYTYSDWSSWSQWSETPSTPGELCDVESKSVYIYKIHQFRCSCGNTYPNFKINLIAEINQTHGSQAEADAAYAALKSGSTDLEHYNALKKTEYAYLITMINDTVYSDTERSFDSKWAVDSCSRGTLYRQRTRTHVKGSKAGAWSEWIDIIGTLPSGSSIQTETRTVYRYRTKK